MIKVLLAVLWDRKTGANLHLHRPIYPQHQFGNGVALFTTKGSAAREFVNSVQVGMVGINVAIPVPLSFYTFGGWKDSIYGSSNIYGMDGVRFYTKTKTVTTRWPDIDEDEDLNLSMPTVK